MKIIAFVLVITAIVCLYNITAAFIAADKVSKFLKRTVDYFKPLNEAEQVLYDQLVETIAMDGWTASGDGWMSYRSGEVMIHQKAQLIRINHNTIPSMYFVKLRREISELAKWVEEKKNLNERLGNIQHMNRMFNDNRRDRS